TYSTDFDLEWREKGWELKSGKWTIFNIAVPDARQHCLDVIKEIYTNYNIDGMIFDDYFYPGDHLTESASAGDYQMWKDANSGLSIGDWRRRNVNEFVAELYEMVQNDRPDMHYGIGPAGTAGKSAAKHGVKPPTAGYDWQYDEIYADPLAWLHEGTIDFISPQIYWARTEGPAYFTPLAEWWDYVAEHFGRHNYISMASYKVNNASFGGNNETGWNEFVAQIEIGRSNATDLAPGQVYFSAKQFDGPEFSGLGDWLETYAYQRPALIPPLTWKEHVEYGAPEGATIDADGKLSWQPVAVPRENTIMRYSIYAVPMSTSIEDAMQGGDGIDGRFLVDVSYATEYVLPEELRNNYWYAVCVYDGYGFEYAPATVNYTGERSAATTPVSPVADAVVDWDAVFTWTAVPGATYIAQLSSREDFSSVMMSQEGLTEPTATFDLSNLGNNSQLYWRVAVCEPNKLYYYT
ncbi:MAG: family 10 glycosylhydrolase, partial [Muribaculaceae bacterium]|nr:family 10 glycosylhydrolase [Muribaculaceae bacterium]